MFIKRKILAKIEKSLEQPEITLITGPRQAGKTTIIKQIQSNLESQGESTIYLNLDIESDFALLESQDKFIFALRNRIGKDKGYVFIDEYQRKRNGGKFIKGIYDMDLPYKFVITGSGSIELKEEVTESLAGRKKTFEVGTLSFFEYFDFQTNYEFEDNYSNFIQLYPEKYGQYLLNYLTYGGYPKLAKLDSHQEKRSALQEIYNSYLLKDIQNLLNIDKTGAFQRLVENLSILDGKLINLTQLANNIGLTRTTLDKYLWYLEQTFIISQVRPYFRNKLKEINKAPTYYFQDIGLKNLISADFDLPNDRVDLGFDFQNLVFLTLQNLLQFESPVSINFWRTKDGAEVDFVLKKGRKFVGVEVKYTDFESNNVSRSSQSFLKKYQPDDFFVVNKSVSGKIDRYNMPVKVIPFVEINKITESLLS